MAKRTTVAIHEVDGTGATGARVGAGTLVAPRGVLVHPPLSKDIAEDRSPVRLRVELRSNTRNGPVTEVIDVRGEPLVMRGEESVGPLVALELRTRAQAPVERMAGVSSVRTLEEFVAFAVPRLGPDQPADSWWDRLWDWWKDTPTTHRNPICKFLRRLC